MPFFGTTANENGLGLRSRGRMLSFALVEPRSPRLSLTLDVMTVTDEGYDRLLFT